MRRHRGSALALVAALGAFVVGGHQAGLSAEALLWMLPVVALAVPLLCGWYAGEELLDACRARRRPAPRRRADPPAVDRSRTAHVVAGRLLAFALAERGPPAPAA